MAARRYESVTGNVMRRAEAKEPVRVHLLGSPTIERDGLRVKADTRKALALLAYLALERGSHGRASLIALLWPDADEVRGRAVLRRTLHTLTQLIPSGILIAEQDQVTLGEDPRLWIDAEEVQRVHRRCIGPAVECADCSALLRVAAELCKEEFLAGFTLKDSVAFDDWQFFQAEAFRRIQQSLLEGLVACLTRTAEYDAAIEYASRWMVLDTLDEAPHLALMRVHALAGRRSAALRQYESCRGILLKEIGEEPSPRVKRLAQDIQSGAFPKPDADLRDAKKAPRDDGPLARTALWAGMDHRPVTLVALRLPGPGQEEAATSFLGSLYGMALRFGGRIERHLGQTLLIVFGRGTARESVPEIAVRAAIEFRAAGLRHRVAVSAGLSSGVSPLEPAAQADGSPSYLSGPAATEARRLASHAKPGEILVSESVFRSTRKAARYLSVRDPEMPRCYRLGKLLEEPGKARGIEGMRGHLVGRTEELGKLRGALDDVLAGGRRVVTIVGEAGVGKSRLVAEGRRAAQATTESRWLEGRCLEIGVAASYWPFIDMLRHYLAWRPEDSDQRHIEGIEQAIRELTDRNLLPAWRAGETVRHLYLLLSATGSEGDGDGGGAEDPEAIRAGCFQAVRDLFVALARGAPLLLVFEDLHWADALTLDLIALLMDTVGEPGPGTAPALGVVCVYRPEQDHRCRHLPALAFEKCPDRYTEIRLRDLTPEESSELAGALLDDSELPEELTRIIVDRSQGNPFFLEEIVRSLIDARVLGRARGRWRMRSGPAAAGVPESVESVILGTTDRLPEAVLRVLRAASVLGRIFDVSVLRGMTRDGESTEVHLRVLEDHGLIYEERTVPRREFSFRHVLTRDAVYAGIPEPARRELHQLAAAVILELVGERPEPYLERLAYHYERAGLQEQAVSYLHQAGRKAIRASDNRAAIELLERALALVRAWPSGPRRALSELEVLVTLGVPVTATTGYGSAETRKVYQRAVDLCAGAGRSELTFVSTYGLWRYHTLQGHLEQSLELAERLTELSRDLTDDTMHLEAQRALTVALMHAGRVREAQPGLEAGMAAYVPARHRGNAFIYGHDPATTFYCYRAVGLWLLGFPDQAAATIDRLCELMDGSTHRLSVSYVYSMGVQVFQLRGDVERVLGMSARGIALAAEGHLPMFGGFAHVMQGWARMMSGDSARGAGLIREGFTLWDAAGGGAFRLYLRSLAADVHRRCGNGVEAAGIL